MTKGKHEEHEYAEIGMMDIDGDDDNMMMMII
jgi:hypothetical protein